MDMLVPYTPVKELSEEEKRRLRALAQVGQGFVKVGEKVVSVNELNGKLPQPPVRQNLFEQRA